MNTIYDQEVPEKRIYEVLDGDKYRVCKFTYPRIWQYYIDEKTIIKDLDKIPIANVDPSKRAVVLFTCGTMNKIITNTSLEWILARIATRILPTSEIVWSSKESDSIGKRKLEISVIAPVRDF